MDLSETIPSVKEAVEDTIKYKAILFHIWMQKNYVFEGEIETKYLKLYDEFELEYQKMMAKNPKKEI